MSFTLEDFARKRPYLFHLTSKDNLSCLRIHRSISPASDLFERAGEPDWTRQKRRTHVKIVVDGQSLSVRDQAPLHAGNMALTEGWSFPDFIAHLNRRVFFWPGSKNGLPIAYGVRHYERYAAEHPVVLRISTHALFTANNGLTPEFCRYNSGSPRWTYGRASPRGTSTFAPCDQADFGAANVVEVTFPGTVKLSAQVEMGASPAGPWIPL